MRKWIFVLRTPKSAVCGHIRYANTCLPQPLLCNFPSGIEFYLLISLLVLVKSKIRLVFYCPLRQIIDFSWMNACWMTNHRVFKKMRGSMQPLTCLSDIRHSKSLSRQYRYSSQGLLIGGLVPHRLVVLSVSTHTEHIQLWFEKHFKKLFNLIMECWIQDFL